MVQVVCNTRGHGKPGTGTELPVLWAEPPGRPTAVVAPWRTTTGTARPRRPASPTTRGRPGVVQLTRTLKAERRLRRGSQVQLLSSLPKVSTQPQLLRGRTKEDPAPLVDDLASALWVAEQTRHLPERSKDEQLTYTNTSTGQHGPRQPAQVSHDTRNRWQPQQRPTGNQQQALTLETESASAPPQLNVSRPSNNKTPAIKTGPEAPGQARKQSLATRSLKQTNPSKDRVDEAPH